MAKIKNLYHLLLIALIVQISLFSTQCTQQPSDSLSIGWLNYQKNNQKFSVSNPQSKIKISFQIPQQSILIESISIDNDNIWRAIYHDNKSNRIRVFSKSENAIVRIQNSQNSIEFTVQLQQKYAENLFVLTKQTFNPSQFQPIQKACIKQNNKKDSEHIILKCQFKLPRLMIIFDNDPKKFQNFQKLSDMKPPKINSRQLFISELEVKTSQKQSFINEFAIQMLTKTLSSICKVDSQYQGFEFYGLCSNQNSKEIDMHFSLLSIDILFKYNSDLAIWLVQNFLDLLEQKLFYSFSGRQWIPIPQHIQVFLTYLQKIHENSRFDQEQLRQKINKVIIIQNGLLNNLLLSQVNHLSQQVNYRQKNQIHPTILKMLSQAWKTDLPRARVSSIYSESFTNDFFYHQKNQKLENSVGKIIWLIKLINQHVNVIKKYGDSFQKQSLQQLISLQKVMKKVVLEEPNAQAGKFHSIIITQKIRVYSRSIGYEALLPFSYELSNAFPTNSILNLTTQIGLGSLPQNHEKYAQNYNFRGNVNLYFNYKILFGMYKNCINNPKNKVFLNGIRTMIQSVQGKIIKSYKQNVNKNKPVFYTSWNPIGKGMNSQNFLSLINIAFLKNVGQKS